MRRQPCTPRARCGPPTGGACSMPWRWRSPPRALTSTPPASRLSTGRRATVSTSATAQDTSSTWRRRTRSGPLFSAGSLIFGSHVANAQRAAGRQRKELRGTSISLISSRVGADTGPGSRPLRGRSSTERTTLAAVDEPATPAAGRHFAGTNTQLVISYLRARTPPGTVDRVLQQAGERRSADVLADAVTWSSYTQFRNLLVAFAAELGEEALVAIGLDAFSEVSVPDTTAMLQALGSPSSLYADIG